MNQQHQYFRLDDDIDESLRLMREVVRKLSAAHRVLNRTAVEGRPTVAVPLQLNQALVFDCAEVTVPEKCSIGNSDRNLRREHYVPTISKRNEFDLSTVWVSLPVELPTTEKKKTETLARNLAAAALRACTTEDASGSVLRFLKAALPSSTDWRIDNIRQIAMVVTAVGQLSLVPARLVVGTAVRQFPVARDRQVFACVPGTMEIVDWKNQKDVGIAASDGDADVASEGS